MARISEKKISPTDGWEHQKEILGWRARFGLRDDWRFVVWEGRGENERVWNGGIRPIGQNGGRGLEAWRWVVRVRETLVANYYEGLLYVRKVMLIKWA